MADPSSPAEPMSEPSARPALRLSRPDPVSPDLVPPGLSPPGRLAPGAPPSGPPTAPATVVASLSAGEATTRLLLPDSWRPRPGGRGQLLATRCPRCGTLTFPVATACPACWNADGLDTGPVAEPGTVYALAVVRVPEPGIEAPYRIGYADFPGGLRICGRFTGPQLDLGDPVEVVTAVLRQQPSGSLVGWAFRKAGA
jgi:uncharacterized protein